MASSKESGADDQHEQYRQEEVSCIGIDVPDVHLAHDSRGTPHGSDQGVERQPVDDVNLRAVPLDCRPKMLCDGFDAVLARRRLEDGLEDDAHGFENPIAV